MHHPCMGRGIRGITITTSLGELHEFATHLLHILPWCLRHRAGEGREDYRNWDQNWDQDYWRDKR